ncbi:MAG: hypothetical protein LBK70_00485 [Clostridiales bacterium]|jgi:hypothetical protein|nr:hypothetical protein [Clostridiales bacterium]
MPGDYLVSDVVLGRDMTDVLNGGIISSEDDTPRSWQCGWDDVVEGSWAEPLRRLMLDEFLKEIDWALRSNGCLDYLGRYMRDNSSVCCITDLDVYSKYDDYQAEGAREDKEAVAKMMDFKHCYRISSEPISRAFFNWSNNYGLTQDEQYRWLDCDKLWDEWLGCEYPKIDLQSPKLWSGNSSCVEYGVNGLNAVSKLNYNLVRNMLYLRSLEYLYNSLKRHFAKGATTLNYVRQEYDHTGRDQVNIYRVKMSELRQGNKYQSLFANCIQRADKSKLFHPDNTGSEVFEIIND